MKLLTAMADIERGKPLESDKPTHKDKRLTRQQRGYDQAHYEIRRQLMINCGGICQMCNADWAVDMDHKDGNSFNQNINNLWILCRKCHLKKTMNGNNPEV